MDISVTVVKVLLSSMNNVPLEISENPPETIIQYHTY